MARSLRQRIDYEADPIKGSRFVAVAAPVASEDEARALLAEAVAAWPDASHHCWAWRLATPAIDRASDDGEPSGSAGRPILAALTGRELVDTAVIVVRWFGGTKLGVGGLVRAYGGTAAAALDAAQTCEWVHQTTVEFTHGHAETGAVERAVAAVGAVEVSVDWGVEVGRVVQVPTTEVDALWTSLSDATNGRITRPSDGDE